MKTQETKKKKKSLRRQRTFLGVEEQMGGRVKNTLNGNSKGCGGQEMERPWKQAIAVKGKKGSKDGMLTKEGGGLGTTGEKKGVRPARQDRSLWGGWYGERKFSTSHETKKKKGQRSGTGDGKTVPPKLWEKGNNFSTCRGWLGWKKGWGAW